MSRDKIWFAYNHNPGGQIVVSHVETRKKRRNLGGEKFEDIVITAEQDLDGITKSSFISLKIKGQPLAKNKVLVYPSSEDLPADPAPQVIAWAIEQGIEPYISDEEKADAQASLEKMKIMQSQIEAMNERNEEQNKKIESLLDTVKTLTETLARKESKANV